MPCPCRWRLCPPHENAAAVSAALAELVHLERLGLCPSGPSPKHVSAAMQEERLQDLRDRSQVPFNADDSHHMVSPLEASRLPSNLQEAKAS